MKLISFRYLNLNNFLSHSIIFNSDVSFIHGINGSGKTTVLKAITAIIGPDIEWLISARYDELELVIENLSDKFCIKLNKQDEQVIISLSGDIAGQTTLSADLLKSRLRSGARFFGGGPLLIQNQRSLFDESVGKSDNVLDFIRKLPSPIFLGLDRTTLIGQRSRAALSESLRGDNPAISHRNMLDDAVDQTVEIAKERLSQVTNEVNKLLSEAQTKFILSLFQQISDDQRKKQQFSSASDENFQRIETVKTNIIKGLRKIKISDKDIASVIVPFFNEAKKEPKR